MNTGRNPRSGEGDGGSARLTTVGLSESGAPVLEDSAELVVEEGPNDPELGENGV